VKGNPQVTGVGTQMHLDMATPDLKNLIVASLTDLKNTGRMVRISELDIKCTSLTDQADLYKFIFQKYLEIVPAAQRGGITIWGINDKDSWVKQEQDGRQNMPLLYQGVNYARKPAWETLYLYLCEVAGLDPYKE
jgi:endo-1,4-beta-xylanase